VRSLRGISTLSLALALCLPVRVRATAQRGHGILIEGVELALFTEESRGRRLGS
jgi:hypothetical protein